MDWAPKDDKSGGADSGGDQGGGYGEGKRKSLLDRKIDMLADRVGVDDPEALVKLIDAVVARCMAEEAAEEEDGTEESEGD